MLRMYIDWIMFNNMSVYRVLIFLCFISHWSCSERIFNFKDIWIDEDSYIEVEYCDNKLADIGFADYESTVADVSVEVGVDDVYIDEGCYSNRLCDIELDDYDSIERDANGDGPKDVNNYNCVDNTLYDVINYCNPLGSEDVNIFEDMKIKSEFYMGGWMNGNFSMGIIKDSLYVLYSDGPEGNMNIAFIFGNTGELLYKFMMPNEHFIGPSIDFKGNAYFVSELHPSIERKIRGSLYKYDRNRNSVKKLKELNRPQSVPPVIDWEETVIFFAHENYEAIDGVENKRRLIYKYKGDNIVLEKQINDDYLFGRSPIVDNNNMIYVSAYHIEKDKEGALAKEISKIEYYDSDLNKIWEYEINPHCKNKEICSIEKMISDGENLYALLSELFYDGRTQKFYQRIISINREGELNWIFEPEWDKGVIIWDIVIDENLNLRFLVLFNYYNFGVGIIGRCGKLLKMRRIDEVEKTYRFESIMESIQLLSGSNIILGGEMHSYSESGGDKFRFFAIIDKDLKLKKIYYYPTKGELLTSIYNLWLTAFIIKDCKELSFVYPWAASEDSFIKGFLYKTDFPNYGVAKSPWPMARGDPQNTGRVQLYK